MVPPDRAREASVRSRADRPPKARTVSEAEAPRHWANQDDGWALMAELLSAILTWGGIGWLLDRWLDTAPWLLMLGLVIGNAAGFYLLYRRSQATIGTTPPATPTSPTRSPAGGGRGRSR